MKFAGMNSTDEQEFSIVFNSMAVSVTVLWLIANLFTSFGGVIRFLLSFGTIVIVTGLGILSYLTEPSKETDMFLSLFVFIALTMLIAVSLSNRFCGGKYRPVRFMLWLAIWMLLVSVIATFGFIIIGSIIMSTRLEFSAAMLMFALAGLIFGLFLYMLNLPFMILGFTHPFFRERLCACLRLKPMPVNPQKADTGIEIPEKRDSV
jgi:hypothetical protein